MCIKNAKYTRRSLDSLKEKISSINNIQNRRLLILNIKLKDISFSFILVYASNKSSI